MASIEGIVAALLAGVFLLILALFAMKRYRQQGMQGLSPQNVVKVVVDQAKEVSKFSFGLLVVLLLLIGVVWLTIYAYYAGESGFLTQTYTDYKAKFLNTEFISFLVQMFKKPQSLFEPTGGGQDIGGQPNGIFIKTFESLKGSNIIKGDQATFEYEIVRSEINYTAIPVFVDCQVDEYPEIRHKILPNEKLLIDKPTATAHCVLNAEDLSELKAGSYIVEASLLYDFKTNSSLDVYFVSRDSMVKDFFRKELQGVKSDFIRSTYYGEPLKIAISPSKDTKQPISLEKRVVDDVEFSTMLLFINLKPEWTGSAFLKRLQITLPKGITIKEDTENAACPFAKVTSHSKTGETAYLLQQEEVKKLPILGVGNKLNYVCYLKDDGTLFENADWVRKQYWAEADYTFVTSPLRTTINLAGAVA